MKSGLKTMSGPVFLARARIISGFILFFYVLTHFINHSMGLWSLEVMESAGTYFKMFWRFLPFSIVLYGAFLTHITLVLIHLYKRRTLSMSGREWTQVILGLAIPFLMVIHMLATRMAHDVYGLNDNYTYVVFTTFLQSPISGYLNVTGLLFVWIHGCIGLYAWARLKSWYKGYWPNIALVIAAVLPVLAITGFVAAGREISILAQDGEWLGEFFENLNLPKENLAAIVTSRADAMRYGFAALLMTILAMRLLRQLRNRQNKQVEIDYQDGPVIRYPVGANLLEISRIHSVPHASVCGGRGRCSTCRVRVLEANPVLIPADEGETKVLSRVRAPSDVRLACQMIPSGKVKVIRLLPADATMNTMAELSSQSSGVEQVVAVLFADIRGFTARSEAKLPFDVVYLVNQFSRAMGDAIETSGGKVDKFLGDGLMALFGIDTSPQEGCRSALEAALKMQHSLDELNTRLAGDLDEPLQVGIGIHAGPVVLGEMGYGASRGLTAIGDIVNTASRLEAATKELAAPLCISSIVAEYAEAQFNEATMREISIRGKRQKLRVHALQRSNLKS
jgi:adenylate cyclase